MADELIISVSGLRGVVGESLTPEVAFRYAAAFAETLPEGTVVVSRDGRANGLALLARVTAGLSQRGTRDVFDVGVAATPTTGVLVRYLGCAGGVQISASHNPAQYNGLKLFSAEGRVVPATVGERVLQKYKMLDVGCSTLDMQQPVSSVEQIKETNFAHLERIEEIVDVERIRARKLRVLLDANHGSGSGLGKLLLERLGCDVLMLGGEPDGQFAHEPEPTAANLAGVLREVTQAQVDVGFCQDPDADRLAIVDENGRYLGEEYTLAICVDHVLRHVPVTIVIREDHALRYVRYEPGAVVTNCSSSRMTEDLARKYGVPFFRSAVGEANVVDKMIRESAAIGGEGNGGVIHPRVGFVRDSFVGLALVLNAMAERDLPVSALADELPRYAIHKSKVTIGRESIPAALQNLERRFPDATSDRLDGLRLDWQHADGTGCWLLVRASNTEPIVRIIAEAHTADQARQLCEEAAKAMQSR